MSGRVIIPALAAEAPTAPASSYDLDQKVRAAAWAGIFTAVLVTVILWAVLVLAIVVDLPAPGGWQTWLGCAFVSLVAGLVVTCRYGYKWVVAVAARPWEVDTKIRERFWKLEDEERAAKEEAQAAAVASARDQVAREDDHDSDLNTFNEAQLLHLVAVEVLRRHYAMGEAVTREAMTAAGFCTQPQWNFVNQAMLAVGLKEKKTMRSGLDFAQAWEIWRASVKIEEDGYLWILNARGSWRALVKVA